MRPSLLLMMLGACAGDEAARITLPVVLDASLITPVTNDLGYTVEVTSLTMQVSGVGFTVEGELHQSFWDDIHDFFIGKAYAHPGHYAGGEVTGELVGPLTPDWFADDPALGAATLLPGDYHGANLDLAGAATITGRATKGDRTIEWSATLDLPDPAVIVGAPLELVVDAGTRATLGLAFATEDPFEHDTVFDGLDFFALAEEAPGPLHFGSGDVAHNVLRRKLYTHDHFFVTVQELDP